MKKIHIAPDTTPWPLCKSKAARAYVCAYGPDQVSVAPHAGRPTTWCKRCLVRYYTPNRKRRA